MSEEFFRGSVPEKKYNEEQNSEFENLFKINYNVIGSIYFRSI
jgi:hypothetical protein